MFFPYSAIILTSFAHGEEVITRTADLLVNLLILIVVQVRDGVCSSFSFMYSYLHLAQLSQAYRKVGSNKEHISLIFYAEL